MTVSVIDFLKIVKVKQDHERRAQVDAVQEQVVTGAVVGLGEAVMRSVVHLALESSMLSGVVPDTQKGTGKAISVIGHDVFFQDVARHIFPGTRGVPPDGVVGFLLIAFKKRAEAVSRLVEIIVSDVG